jgi:hypothetical protein
VITAPQENTTVSGVVPIRKTASWPGFDYYVIEYQQVPTQDPTRWELVGQFFTPVIEGQLGLWDTRRLQAGRYALRVRVVAGAEQRAIVWQVIVR